MDDDTLAAACRPGVAADALLLAATARGASDEPADTGDLAAGDAAEHLARTYARRVRHLAAQGLLVVDAEPTLADLDRLVAAGTVPRVVVRTERVHDGRVVYTALLSGAPPQVQASFVHRLPYER